MKIKVPATTANLGPGFDSFGLALSLYLEVEVIGHSDSWVINHDMEGIPVDESNLIVQSALHVCPDLRPQRMNVQTAIPTARGLGSSSSAIVAGIELANELGLLRLTDQEKLDFAVEIEGHPDNVAPAIMGGFVVACQTATKSYVTKHEFPECDLSVVIPDYELLTKMSRDVLPETVGYAQGVEASALANVVLSSLLSNNLRQAGELMEQDMWHEQYREPLVPELIKIKTFKEELGFYGAVLSGAGPTILILSPKEKTETLIEKCQTTFPNFTVMQLTVDKQGVTVTR